MIELDRDDLINLLKLALARVNELENIISGPSSELEKVPATVTKSPWLSTLSSYPPNWPYGQKSKKTMENVFGYYQGVEPGDYE